MASTDVMINFFNEAILHLKDYNYSFEEPKKTKIEVQFSPFHDKDFDAFMKAFENSFNDRFKYNSHFGGDKA